MASTADRSEIHRYRGNLQPQLLTCPADVGQSGSVPLGVDGDHGDAVAGVWEEFLQDRCGGALRNLLLQ